MKAQAWSGRAEIQTYPTRFMISCALAWSRSA